ncbi:Alpha-D-ribose 1-methylphosphonate 5-triphosphate synthase subunit PhnG [Afipia felis]|uniref:Alpha-D-ribose 1-methylphosphonate 5-triphosphate synthase subunit PhnG n=1 Tax=Afipia felis TaxID=1035 RepID=A0A090MT74_AFIFE|nr:phosphonate C-P lyase system protein PhnG [Afipia felis]CEG10560.1 Alpha-D-ribose 1-methylphosphonate 5-triphosphate synthase subunit PhnG [Afipia felis]
MIDASSDPLQSRRQSAMAVLAHSATPDIAGCIGKITVPAHEPVRMAESGLIMLRGRIGGDGAPFNVGEVTVSRAAMRLASGEMGFGYILGRDTKKAELIALCDALIQTRDYADLVEVHVLAPLRGRYMDERQRRTAEAAATKVDFYTLVRGEG